MSFIADSSAGPARRAWPVAIAASVIAGFALLMGGCGMEEEKPFDPAAIQKLYRSRIPENMNRPLKPLPTELDKTYLSKREGKDPASKPSVLPTTQESIGPAVRMGLRDLIQLAAINSLDVKIAGYQPAIDENRVIEAWAKFDPTLFAGITASSQWVLQPSPQMPTVTSGSNLRFDTLQIQGGIKQTLLSGAQVQLGYTYTKTYRIPSAGVFNPSYESDLVLQITQPLLQNFGTAVNRARIDVARNTQKVSLLDFRLALEKNLSEIEEAYWQLVQGDRDLSIQERLYADTVKTSEMLQGRAGQDVTRVQLGQANAALRAREASLIQARTRVRTLSNAIKRRVNDPALPLTSGVTILPSDSPFATPIQFDLIEQLETALQNRAELAQQRIRIDSAKIIKGAAKNNLMPSLNLVLSMGTQGADGRWQGAMERSADVSFPQYSVGLQLEIPLGNREARAIWRRTQLQELQAIDQYRVLIEQVTQDVKDAHDSLVDGWERIRLNRQSVLAAREALEALQQERQVGQAPFTPDFINRLLQQQEVLANAEREETRATADYNVAISQLERAKGTILKYDNVMMAEDPLTVPGPILYGQRKAK